MKEPSYGIIPIRKKPNGWDVFVVKEYGYWGFPKGHLEAGETPQEAAQRELREETGLIVTAFLSLQPIEIDACYQWKGKEVSRTFVFFVAEVEGTISLRPDEVEDGQWHALDTTTQKVAFTPFWLPLFDQLKEALAALH